MSNISQSIERAFAIKSDIAEIESFISKHLKNIDEGNYATGYEILTPKTIKVYYGNVETGDMGYATTININK